MALSPGAQVGPYQITALIGQGGMGAVYKAHDPRLGRDVAIKVADEAFTERFTQEARAIAALNHTNVCHLYDVGPNYLVMEFVEGATLQGPMAFEDALPILRQIIDGIEAAHEKGIVHRDLKPANIKVTPEGVVKILDFGLAKALEPERLGAELTNSPTMMPMGGTLQGTIIGTSAYMAPEQAKGKQADRRADIWAFGVVLYELLTGKKAFEGETTVEILGAVLNKEPDLSAAPPRVQKLLRWCLEKDRKERLQAIGDARRLLAEEPIVAAAPATKPATSVQTRLAWAMAATLAIGLAAVSWLYLGQTLPEQPLMRLSIALPGNTAPGFFALSPDGRQLVMTYQGGLGIRALDSNEIRLLAGTQNQGPRTPFWSPDSRTVAFFSTTDRKLKNIPASGGPAQTLCEETGTGGNGGSWSRDGVIVYATSSGALYRVPAGGGPCTEIAKAEPGVRASRLPMFLPDGNQFLYVGLSASDESRRGLFVASLADPIGRRLLADSSSGVFVPDQPGSNRGRLLFVREQTLMAQTFDAATAKLSGEPSTVAEQVSFTFTSSQIAASAASNGTLVYVTNGQPDKQLVWYDRAGKEIGRSAPVGTASGGVALAPDGKRVAFTRVDAQSVGEKRLLDLERNQEIRLFPPPVNPVVVWSPNSDRIAFARTAGEAQGLYVKQASGGTEELLLPRAENPRVPSEWSRDERWIVYTENDPKTGADIWLLPDPLRSVADRKPVAWLRTPSNESQGQISPDGKWMAYYSNESGDLGHVYLRPFTGGPAPDSKWTVSAVRGQEPRWRADSKELFFLEQVTGTRRFKIMSASIGAAPNPVGTPKQLFEIQTIGIVAQANSFLYSVSPDGRFLMNVFATEAQPSLEVLLNWGKTAAMK